MSLVEFWCECGCGEQLELGAEEYMHLVRPYSRVVVPGHRGVSGFMDEVLAHVSIDGEPVAEIVKFL